MSDIKVGDVVYLKSGGPAMTVSSKPNTLGNVKCVWFSGEKADSLEVKPEALTKENPQSSKTPSAA